MKVGTKIALMLVIAIALTQCKKEDNPETVYQPRYFISGGGGFGVVDARDTKSISTYFYSWNSVSGKYEYNTQSDTSTIKELKLWPSAVTDPVAVGFTYHFLDRASGNTTYTINYSSISLDVSSLSADQPALSSAWRQPSKIDGYANLFELYGVSNGYSSFYFDFAEGTYVFIRSGDVVTEEKIDKLITLPKGTLVSSPIDFTKADAVMYDYDRVTVPTASNNMYFLDYDAMKYVQINRKDNLAGDIARNTLVTSDWRPISELISGWKF